MSTPSPYRRSLARHLMSRRLELLTLATVSAAAACAAKAPGDGEITGTSSAALVTTLQGTTAAQKAMNYLVPDAVQFTKDNNCLSCHRQPDVLISASTAASLLPGTTLDTSASTGTGYIANLVTGNQAGDGSWTDSGSTLSMSAESLWALAGYARAGGPINVLPNVKKGLLWAVPKASTVTFPNDGAPFAGGQRTYLNNDFTDSPQMFDWFLPTTQSVFATRVILDLGTGLSASDVSTLSAQQVSYTDALEGTVMRALTTSTVQQLSLTAIAMAESGRASSADGKTISAQILARQTSGSGWGDAFLPDGSLQAVNTLTSGQALYALCRLGVRPRVNVAAGAGLDWLIGQQQGDGSWALPNHNSAVSSSWALLAVACTSNPSGTAEFDPLTANGSPSAPVTESFTSVLNVTNTSSDARTATITVAGGPPGAIITVTPSTLTLVGDASAPVNVAIKLPAGLTPSTSYPFTATVAFAGANNASSTVVATFTTAIGATPDAALTATTTTWLAPPTRVDIGDSVALSAQVAGSDGQAVTAGGFTYSLDGTVFATVSAAGGVYPTTWKVPTLPVGSHTLHAAYLGSSGAVVFSPSSPADLIIDVEPPAPPAPVVSGVTDGSSSTSGQYDLSGTGTPGDTVAILANVVVVRTTTVGSDGTWGASFSLSPGAYAIGVVETGPGGSSSPTTSHVTVQPTAPTVAGPASGTTFTSMMTTVSGTGTPGATITVSRGSTVLGTTTAGSDGSYSLGVELAAGPNDLTVSQTVNGETSALSNVTYNQTPSAPSITTPTSPATRQLTPGMVIKGAAVPGSTVLLLDNGVVIGSATAGADGSYAIPATLSTGMNNLSVTSSVGGVPGAASALFTVRVDGDAPFFPAPPVDLLAYAPTSGGVAVSWPALTAFDAQDGKLATTCDHASGDTFPLGATTVTCSAADTLGNASSTSFQVKVVLQVLPTLQMPAGKSIVVKTAIATGAYVSFDVTALDAEGAPLAALCAPASGSFFAAGTTKVNCTATDGVAMTSATSAFDVTVIPVPYYGVDNAAPSTAGASTDSGGCNTTGSGSSGDLGVIAAVGIAIAAARRRRRGSRCVD
jgi:hypothetical protein